MTTAIGISHLLDLLSLSPSKLENAWKPISLIFFDSSQNQMNRPEVVSSKGFRPESESSKSTMLAQMLTQVLKRACHCMPSLEFGISLSARVGKMAIHRNTWWHTGVQQLQKVLTRQSSSSHSKESESRALDPLYCEMFRKVFSWFQLCRLPIVCPSAAGSLDTLVLSCHNPEPQYLLEHRPDNKAIAYRCSLTVMHLWPVTLSIPLNILEHTSYSIPLQMSFCREALYHDTFDDCVPEGKIKGFRSEHGSMEPCCCALLCYLNHFGLPCAFGPELSDCRRNSWKDLIATLLPYEIRLVLCLIFPTALTQLCKSIHHTSGNNYPYPPSSCSKSLRCTEIWWILMEQSVIKHLHRQYLRLSGYCTRTCSASRPNATDATESRICTACTALALNKHTDASWCFLPSAMQPEQQEASMLAILSTLAWNEEIGIKRCT